MGQWVTVILIATLQGVTEWLPVSSTGHMILLGALLPTPMPPALWELFLVVVQLGSVTAVLCRFWRRLSPFGQPPTEARAIRRLWGRVLIAAIPAAVFGLLFDDAIEARLYAPVPVAAALIGYGVVFLVMEKFPRPPLALAAPEAVSLREALTVGLFQVLALVPGTSRSGATIFGAMATGFSRGAAAEFSFFLALPTMLGAGGLKAIKFFTEGGTVSLTEGLLLLVGCGIAFAVSMLVIDVLLDFVKRHSFAVFGWYRIALGLLVLGAAATGLLGKG